jgi:hypothetical protein
VDLIAGEISAGSPARFRLFVHQRPRSTAIDNLQVEHEKLMHLIGVRDDLSQFFHIHPLKVSPGTWEVTHTFAEGGTYQLWVDVKWKGVSYSLALPPVKVLGEIHTLKPPNCAGELTVVGDYQVRLRHDGTPQSTQTNLLQFEFTDNLGQPIPVENFLGAPMHLVLVNEERTTFLHAHPESHLPGASLVKFNQVFSLPGRYKLFAQFRPQTAKLPPDEAFLAEFWVEVK